MPFHVRPVDFRNLEAIKDRLRRSGDLPFVRDMDPSAIAIEPHCFVARVHDDANAVGVACFTVDCERDVGEAVIGEFSRTLELDRSRELAVMGPLGEIEVVGAHIGDDAAASVPVVPP